MSKYISGVILYDETIRQNAKDGTPLVKLIEKAGALPGIKVDKGTKPLPFCPGEVDHRRPRRPARAARRISRARRQIRQMARGDRYRPRDMPSYTCISANAHALARYAALCQDEGIVPIVEPEVLMDGDHDIDRCAKITEWVLKDRVRAALLSTASRSKAWCSSRTWSVPGKKSAKRASVEEVAEKTLRVLKACVPAAVPGIAFLSGGQSDEDATAHLDAMNKMGPLPWRVTSPTAARCSRAAEDLVGQVRKRRRRATRLQPPRHDERPRHARPMESRSRAESGVRTPPPRERGRGRREAPGVVSSARRSSTIQRASACDSRQSGHDRLSGATSFAYHEAMPLAT